MRPSTTTRRQTTMHSLPRRRPGATGPMLGALALALFATAACSDLLEVEPRSRIAAEALERPENATLLLNGVIGDFECALGAYATMGALVGEELDDATQTADRYPYDQRKHQSADRRYAVNSCENLGVYTPLQTARSTADNLLRLLARSDWQGVPNRGTMVATASAYSGYAYVLLGEGFCTLAFSSFEDGNPVYGGEVQRDSAFALAEARFTTAIAEATTAGNSDILNMARVGRARARLNRGRYAAAAADAALVPATYVKNATASATSSRRNNRLWAQNSTVSTLTSVGAPYRTLGDPRVPVVNLNRVSTTLVPLWRQDKFTAAATPIPIASGDEAQLIVAEADVREGTAASLTRALATINMFRARGNQAPLATADQATLLAALIDQRRRELFLEGQHLGDLIRFDIVPQPAEGSAFPGGGTYGAQKCFPLPDVERLNNPTLG